MRTTSDFFASALVRRAFADGAMALVARRGAPEAGAVFVKLNRLDGTFDLFAPAPQSFVETPGERRFEHRLVSVPEADIDARLASEARMDPDFWVVEIEDRHARSFVDVVTDD